MKSHTWRHCHFLNYQFLVPYNLHPVKSICLQMVHKAVLQTDSPVVKPMILLDIMQIYSIQSWITMQEYSFFFV